ncbi:hypothetical protein [Ectobacillus sp. sgz5001026]|uniref:hypothetical protein n=1 Tax=Ectobacillus sp. sgz5001026 TaxID=3242473 RepID=UPI0036D20C1F
MIDAYDVFMSKFGINEEELIKFGVEESKFIDKTKVKNHWEKLKFNIETGNQTVFIRGYGRDAKGTNMYIEMYKELFGHSNFKKDATNNAVPTKVIKELTGFSKNVKNDNKYEQIRNYQVSHIFARTKNPFAFSAPWNIVYVPKIVDPFTGHESKGDLTNKFQKQFQAFFIDYYSDFILEFNNIMTDIFPKLKKYLEKNIINEQFKNDALKQFEYINKPNM